MRLHFSPSIAVGAVTAPPSKSAAHRALLAASFAQGESRITGISDSGDMKATMDSLASLGARFYREKDAVRVCGIKRSPDVIPVLNCRESGSTLRFLIPYALTLGKEVTFTGTERLFERNLEIYEEICREKGFLFEKKAESLTVKGALCGGDFALRGDISSQFFTGLLFALPLLDQPSRITFTTPPESASYLDLTVGVLASFGVTVKKEENGFSVPAPQRFRPRDFAVEGDWSNAAFPEAFSQIGGKVSVTGLKEESLQGDKVYRKLFPMIRKGSCTIDLADCPDLAPVLFAMSSLFYGAEFLNTRRLSIKESDRAAAMKEELEKCGAHVKVEENRVIVEKGKMHAPEEALSSHNDHRIAMALSLVLSRFGGDLDGAECVRKSYPDYWDVIRRLGIKVNE